jgi:DNA-binding MarR family transcriptional regulator
MEERGFITRKQDETDKRCSRNYLTKAGLELIEVLPQLAQSCLDDTFESISDDDKEFFRSFLNEVISNFD